MKTEENSFGLDMLRKAVEQGGEVGPMMKTLGQKIVSVAPGEVTVEGTPDHQHENIMGRIHGGFLAALIDTAMGASVATKLPPGTGFGTVDLAVKFVRRFEVATGPVYATAQVLHAGRTMFTVECKVADKSGLLYAHGQGTFLVYPK